MFPPDVVEVYERLKPKLGEDETKTLLRFVEDRTVHLVRDEIAKGLATKDDIAPLATRAEVAAIRTDMATRAEVAAIRTDMATRAEVASLREEMARMREDMDKIRAEMFGFREATVKEFASVRVEMVGLKQEIRDVERRMRLYVVVLAALIIATNPRVLDFLTGLLGIAR